MLHAGVPPAAAKPLAHEGVSLEALKQFDVAWAVGILAERHVGLNPRQMLQIRFSEIHQHTLLNPRATDFGSESHEARVLCAGRDRMSADQNESDGDTT